MTLYIGDKPVGLFKVVEKKVPKTKFGASVDTWIGNVDANGALKRTQWVGELDFSGVKELHPYALYYAFCGRAGITNINLSSLTKIDGLGLGYCFYDTNIVGADLRSLTSIWVQGFEGAFQACDKFAVVNLSSLTSVASGGLRKAFQTTILTTLSFPSLINVELDSFGTGAPSNMLTSCNALTEIHFRADMQATIEAMSQYGSKWGATNATIYFDLIGTITVNGVAYSRSEPNSIYVDRVKTYVAWKDASDNIVYTDATAEPAVGTVVYSDQGTTQVGTVEGVA